MPTNAKNLPQINVKEEMGFVPTSVWNITKSPAWVKAIGDSGEAQPKRKSTNKFLPGLKYSSFNPSVAEAIIRYWSKEQDLVVDPFSGRSTRAFVALTMNRQYTGYEISPYALAQMSKNALIQSRATIHCSDGCVMEHTADDAADLIFTCPPYFNLEKYESVPHQLTDIVQYDAFLDKMAEALSNCYRVLKQGKYCVWVVGDFRLDRQVCVFHSDIIRLGKENGFKLHDVVVEQVRSPFVWCRARENYRLGITAKSHQYILVFKKADLSQGKKRASRD